MRRLIRKAEVDLEVNDGDLVDFGPYGKLYVCNADYEENKFWITDEKQNRDDASAQGWAISKNFAKRIIESYEDEYDDEDEEYDDDEYDEYDD